MISICDLRAGNTIYIPQGVGTVIEVLKDSVWVCLEGEDFFFLKEDESRLSPYKITDEILPKLGFEYDRKARIYLKKLNEDEFFFFDTYYNRAYRANQSIESDPPGKVCNAVHELQNAYYDLTGEMFLPEEAL